MKNKKIIWIADFYIDQVYGGGELVNEFVISSLREDGWEVEKWLCHQTTVKRLSQNRNSFVFVGNFIRLPSSSMQFIVENFQYIIYEHDHKYVQSRDPSTYKDYNIPVNRLVNQEFYKESVAVICQSELHANILQKNLMISNVVAMKCSMWSEKDLQTLRKYSCTEKNGKYFVLNSSNPIKNTRLAIKYCEENNFDYDVHGPLKYEDLMEKMANYSAVVFFPRVLETFNRFIVEARALGCNLITNSKNGATHQDWFPDLKDVELIDFILENNKESTRQITKLIETGSCDWLLDPIKFPRVSIITSLYKGEKHIRDFLENMTSQTYFNNCELIIINANSPENEDPIVQEFMKKYDNIIYRRLDHDPGIYGTWNIAMELSNGDFFTNANLDDRRALNHIEVHARELMLKQDIDLVYSEAFVTNKDFETFYNNSSAGKVYPITDFSEEAMVKCLPGCMPIWRKSMHENIGLFDTKYKSAGDWEMWLRAVRNGSKFSKIPGVYGLYYSNPKGLSTDPEKQKERFGEEREVFWKYVDLFGNEAPKYTSHFVPPKEKKKLICFSLWGDNPVYTIGALKNAELAKEYYPDWICRYYIGSSTPKDIIEQLKVFDNTEVVEMEESGDWTGMFWRFYAASEPDVYAMISRDTDSRLNKREALAVKQWLDSNKDFHIMRDHPYHATEILGGMWGVKDYALLGMKKMINEYVKGDFWQVDQNFLKEKIYPLVKDSSFLHDEFFDNSPFPTKRKTGEFIGQAFDENDKRLHPEHSEMLVKKKKTKTTSRTRSRTSRKKVNKQKGNANENTKSNNVS